MSHSKWEQYANSNITYHPYFNKIIENAKTFIDYGGNAVWQYIIFNHNIHQVEEAKHKAIELGFSSFTLKDSSRFLLDTK